MRDGKVRQWGAGIQRIIRDVENMDPEMENIFKIYFWITNRLSHKVALHKNTEPVVLTHIKQIVKFVELGTQGPVIHAWHQ